MGSGVEPASNEELAVVLRLCRDARVKRLRWGALEVEFTDPLPPDSSSLHHVVVSAPDPGPATPLEDLQYAASGVRARSLRELLEEAREADRAALPAEIVVGS